MSIYAISDLHLSFGDNKPMDIFGDNWIKHYEKIKEDWVSKVKDTDVVLLPGDFSWATYLKDLNLDLDYLESMPGIKILSKGNHDYWWETVNKMNAYLKENKYENINFLYNNSYFYDDHIIVGARGWSYTDDEESIKILKREMNRLEISITDGIKKYGNDKPIIVCIHYPPFVKNENFKENYPDIDFTKIIKKYNAKMCIYGHLHGSSQSEIIEGNIEKTEYKMVSCDYTNFKLIKLI